MEERGGCQRICVLFYPNVTLIYDVRVTLSILFSCLYSQYEKEEMSKCTYFIVKETRGIFK